MLQITIWDKCLLINTSSMCLCENIVKINTSKQHVLWQDSQVDEGP